MDLTEFKELDGLLVNRLGDVKYVDGTEVPEYRRKYITGYLYIKSKFVHRLIAKLFVPNPDPEKFKIVNHIDGCKTNNRWDNLEWCDYRHNNQMAVYQGLQPGSDACLVRDYDTGIVHEFPSISEAKRFMGVALETLSYTLYPSRFGHLTKGKYEFRLKRDIEKYPFFYPESSEKKVNSKYAIRYIDQNGIAVTYYHKNDLLRDFIELSCDLREVSIEALSEIMNDIYPSGQFELLKAEDYLKNRGSFGPRNDTRPVEIYAYDSLNKKGYIFKSIIETSKFTKCDKRLVRESPYYKRPVNKYWYFARMDKKDQLKWIKSIIEENSKKS